jgi:hypothetical protein
MLVCIVLEGIGAIYSASKGPDATIFSSLQIIYSEILRLNPHSQICKFLVCASSQIENPQFFLFIRKFQNQKFPRCVKEDKEDKTHILKKRLASFRPFYDKATKNTATGFFGLIFNLVRVRIWAFITREIMYLRTCKKESPPIANPQIAKRTGPQIRKLPYFWKVRLF